jgi:DNA-binding LacI/PurR family transcriptional regulator
MDDLTDDLPSRRATIRDVAAEANVSIATVSLYLQGGKGVAGNTSDRIAAAIKKLDYVPRPRAGNGRKGGFVALVLEGLSLMAFPEAIYGAVIRAIELEARRHELGLLLATVDEGSVPQSVRDNQVEGVIILGGSPGNDALAIELAARKVPLVLVDTYNANLPVDALVPDNEWGGYNAFEHLVALGHRQIAIIEGPPKYKTLTDRRWGALRAAEELGVPIPPYYRHPSISSGHPKKGYREMKQLLALPQPPTAVFAVSDRAALGALDAIKEAGLRVPEDISLVGFDDLANAEHAVPPLTTVHYAREEMGTLALRCLLDRIDHKTQAPTRTCVLTELVVRASTALCRG